MLKLGGEVAIINIAPAAAGPIHLSSLAICFVISLPDLSHLADETGAGGPWHNRAVRDAGIPPELLPLPFAKTPSLRFGVIHLQ